MWTYRTRSIFESLRRIIQAQKFYRTLRFRLDREERRWHKSQPKSGPEIEHIEHPPNGSEAQRLLGGPIQKRYKFPEDDDNRKV